MHTEIFYKNLGQKLKYLRKQSGMTQEQLGMQLGITKSAIVNYETGIRKIPFDLLVKIADQFQITIDSLITKQKTLADLIRSEIGQTELTDHQEKLLISYIEILLEGEK